MRKEYIERSIAGLAEELRNALLLSTEHTYAECARILDIEVVDLIQRVRDARHSVVVELLGEEWRDAESQYVIDIQIDAAAMRMQRRLNPEGVARRVHKWLKRRARETTAALVAVVGRLVPARGADIAATYMHWYWYTERLYSARQPSTDRADHPLWARADATSPADGSSESSSIWYGSADAREAMQPRPLLGTPRRTFVLRHAWGLGFAATLVVAAAGSVPMWQQYLSTGLHPSGEREFPIEVFAPPAPERFAPARPADPGALEREFAPPAPEWFAPARPFAPPAPPARPADPGALEREFALPALPPARLEAYWQAISRIPDEPIVLGVGGSTPANVGPDEGSWFYFVAPQSRVYAIQAERSAGPSFLSLDPVIAVYSVADDELDFRQFNDDNQMLDAGVSIALEQGVGYYVGVSDIFGRRGPVSVSVE